ncbi:MAG: ABC transporter permease, partial [Gemmatimonadaceae bacterium]
MKDLLNDIRFAIRALRRAPGFTAVVVLTLALGIGANTAIFSVFRGVLLKPLPHRDGDRLVYLRQSADGPGRANLTFSVPEVRDLRNGVGALSGLAEYSSWSAILQLKDGPMRLDLGLVTGNYFEVMGLSAILGRVTRPGDDGPAAEPVMVLAYETWKTRFGGDTSIVGRHVSVNNTPATVIGVLQPAPFFPEQVHALMNMVISAHHVGASMQDGRTHRMTEVVARLRPDATVGQVRTEVDGVYSRLQNDFKEAYDPAAHYRVAVIPFRKVLGERAEQTLWLLMASAMFVLIVSAANVANLTLMRGVRREHELVLRAALGASAPTLRRLLLVENLVLAIAGAGIGMLIAANGVGMLTTFAARYSPRADEIGLDAS